jgi:multidrug efflux system outer membrane protein
MTRNSGQVFNSASVFAASCIEVLDAQRSLFDAELQYVSVRGDVYTSLVNTYKAMGGGWVIQAQASAGETDMPPP